MIVLARGREAAIRAMEQVMIYEWELIDPEKGFNMKGGTGRGDDTGGQIRYQLRKSEWKEYSPPWFNVPLLFNSSVPIAALDLLNDMNTIVKWFEDTRMNVGDDMTKHLRDWGSRLTTLADSIDRDADRTLETYS